MQSGPESSKPAFGRPSESSGNFIPCAQCTLMNHECHNITDTSFKHQEKARKRIDVDEKELKPQQQFLLP